MEPEIYANALIAEFFDGSALTVGDHSDQPKPWIIDSGCSSHFCPNKSEFITYTPFDSPRKIRLGNASLIPALGEGTISITCSANGIHVQCQIQNVQYIPNLTYGLLSCKVLSWRGLSVVFKDGGCKILHGDRSVIAESLKISNQLYFLTMSPPLTPQNHRESIALVTAPSFNLVHKRLAHPGKATLQLMIRKKIVHGLNGVPDDSADFNCTACIRRKMTQGPFQEGHEVATE